MAREAIKDYTGKIIGYIETKSNGDKVIFDWTGRKLGEYIKSLDLTRDFYFKPIAKGDCIMMLLR